MCLPVVCNAVEDVTSEVAKNQGGAPLRPHEATKVVGEVLAELDRPSALKPQRLQRAIRAADLPRVEYRHRSGTAPSGASFSSLYP
jgi:hypothetical protein